MNNFCKSILMALLLGIITFISLGFFQKDIIVGQDDSLRHAKFAQMIVERGFQEVDTKYNWGDITEKSILETYNVDLWQGHHLFLSELLKLGVSVSDLSNVYVVFFVIVISFFVMYLNFELKNPFLLGIGALGMVLFFNDDIFFRILLARPFLLTSAFFFFTLIVLYSKKFLYFIPLFFLASWYHFLFLLLFLPLVVYLIVYRNEVLKILGSSFLGSFLGMLVHTKSLSYLILGVITVFWIPVLQIKSQVPVSELGSYSGMSLYLLLSIFVILNFYLYALVQQKKVTNLFQDKFYIFLTSLTALLFLLSIFISRFMDFLSVTFLFCFLYTMKKIFEGENYQLGKKINIIGSILVIFFIFVFQTLAISSANKDEKNNISEKKIFLTSSQKYLEKGSLISGNDFYYFYYFYYYLGDEYKYLMNMEKMYVYLYDKELFSNLQDVLSDHKFKPKNAQSDLYDTLQKLGVKYYVILEEKQNYLFNRSLLYKIDQIKKDPRFTLLYQYKNNYLWKIQ